MSGTSTGRSWFRYGCFGCLGVVGFVLLLVGAAVLAAYLGVRNEDVFAGATGGLTPAATQGSASDEPAAPGTMTLELSGGRFEIVAAEPGEPAFVEATYDRNRNELTETFEPDGRGGWDYRVRFTGKGNKLIRMLQGVLGGTSSKVTVRVPGGGPVDLRVRVDNGDLRADLAGMWLRESRFDVTWAGLSLDCSEPLQHPVDSLEVHINMAGLELAHVGNATPSRLLVDVTKGGGAVDLRGAWTRDAHVGITGRMTGIAVQLPDNARVEGAGGPPRVPPQTEIPLPTIYIDANVVDGEIEFGE